MAGAGKDRLGLAEVSCGWLKLGLPGNGWSWLRLAVVGWDGLGLNKVGWAFLRLAAGWGWLGRAGAK